MDNIAVLVPCYNESKTVAKVISDFSKYLPEAAIYIYDNNSSDGTDDIARRTLDSVGCKGGVFYEYKQGKGNVIRRMFREIDADCYILVDGDDTYPAEFARQMADFVLSKNVDMVVGDRLSSTYLSQNKRPFHNFGNLIVRKSVNFIFKSEIKDIMTGFRAFSYQFVKTFPVLSHGFEIETEMSIHAIDKNLSVENCIIDYRDRPKGSVSKLNTYSDGIKVIRTIIRLFRIYRPLPFFSMIAFFLFGISFAFFLPVLLDFFKTGKVERFPTLIVCGFSIVAAIQSFFSGLILHTISVKSKQDFEMNLIRVQEEKKQRK